ncbi:hypothetical protein BaRGS_00030657 [Batillaria attramentaria]|uniref:Uncharacterized protein n=1 Tax=Batillaria attramentaria TaxID=370345 RepID=A0ABD0JT72_9CAEN
MGGERGGGALSRGWKVAAKSTSSPALHTHFKLGVYMQCTRDADCDRCAPYTNLNPTRPLYPAPPPTRPLFTPSTRTPSLYRQRQLPLETEVVRVRLITQHPQRSD